LEKKAKDKSREKGGDFLKTAEKRKSRGGKRKKPSEPVREKKGGTWRKEREIRLDKKIREGGKIDSGG